MLRERSEPIGLSILRWEYQDRQVCLLEYLPKQATSEKLCKNPLFLCGKREQIDIKFICIVFYSVINIFVYN